jgi:hypothetical protein
VRKGFAFICLRLSIASIGNELFGKRMNASTVKIPTARAVAGFIGLSLPCHAATRGRRGRRAARPEILFTVPARWCELDKATDAGAFATTKYLVEATGYKMDNAAVRPREAESLGRRKSRENELAALSSAE